MVDLYADIARRVERLPVRINELGLDHMLGWLKDSVDRGKPDRHLYDIINDRVSDIEESLLTDAFVEPPSSCGLDAGDIHILTTQGGCPVRIGFGDGSVNQTTHVVVGGQTATGKSFCMANLAIGTASNGNTLVIDSNKTYRRIAAMHSHHRLVRLEDLRINLWDMPDGVPAGQVDQIVNHEVCKSYGLQFAEYEINEVVAAMRQRGEVPNLLSVIYRLETQTYKGWTNRARYRDSAVLILSNLMRATGDLFRCKKGMDLRRLMDGNTVIEMSGLPEHQAMIVRYLFEYVHLLALAGGR
ncbi:MAG: hypothetical protein IT445_06210 [Phycisphaeraceae bacterium]|nr:hypothetical protein [Phycisphaeraceae bacterium]